MKIFILFFAILLSRPLYAQPKNYYCKSISLEELELGKKQTSNCVIIYLYKRKKYNDSIPSFNLLQNPKTEKLTIVGNCRHLSSKLSSLLNLEEVIINNNYSMDLPLILKELGQVRNLKKISFGMCGLKDFKGCKFSFSNLTHLALTANKFDKIPPELKDISNLTHLNLRHNRISKIDNLGKNISVLTLWGNRIRKIENLENVSYLDIRDNDLGQYIDYGNHNDTISLKLQTITFGNNGFADFPNLRGFPNLKQIDLGINNVEFVPGYISTFKYLEDIRICNGLDIKFSEKLKEIKPKPSFFFGRLRIMLLCNDAGKEQIKKEFPNIEIY